MNLARWLAPERRRVGISLRELILPHVPAKGCPRLDPGRMPIHRQARHRRILAHVSIAQEQDRFRPRHPITPIQGVVMEGTVARSRAYFRGAPDVPAQL
jgi:hypothetical protein